MPGGDLRNFQEKLPLADSWRSEESQKGGNLSYTRQIAHQGTQMSMKRLRHSGGGNGQESYRPKIRYRSRATRP